MTMTDPGAELALRAQPVLPMSPEQARGVMQAYHDMCKSVLGPDDVQRVGDREFTKRSGFQKLAAAYGVSTEILGITEEQVVRDEEKIIVIRATVRATHPSGRHADGDGTCASNEKRFRKGDEKLEHNLSATAVTRAVNRAVSNLIAFGSVSAEEAEEGAPTGSSAPPSLPEWALPMNDVAGVARNLTRVLKAAGVDDTAAIVSEIGNTIFKQADGGFPFIAARVVGLLAQAVETQDEPSAVEQAIDAEFKDVPDHPTENDAMNRQMYGQTTTTTGEDE